MKFYIVKKDHQLEAIPADKDLLERYESDQYSYVNVVSACNKQDALKRLSTEQKNSSYAKRVCVAFGNVERCVSVIR